MVAGMRSSTATGADYVEMLDTFGPAVCRKKHWTKNHNHTLSEMMTPQLEAFLLMELENIVPVEVEKFTIEKKKKEAASSRNTRRNTGIVPETEIPEPKEKYKYSLGVGPQFSNTSPRTCNGYFNVDGVKRFYSLVEKVTADRASDIGKKVEDEFKQKKSEQQLSAPPPGIDPTSSSPQWYPDKWCVLPGDEPADTAPLPPLQQLGHQNIPPGLNEDV